MKSGDLGERGPHVSTAFLLAVAVVSLAACATSPSGAPQLMFVQTAEDLKVDPAASTIRLVKVNQQTLYFADRPDRIAGHITTADYLREWTARAGKDNFAADPPNATLSVYEPGRPDNTLVVIKITKPVVDGADLVYSYRIVSGMMPASGGVTALFIDGIGVGGSPGFHGVGFGGRGIGLR